MPRETDERLKNYLDTNQLHREQLCLAVLSLDKRFSDVRPRHPRGGPDGGRDIEATFRNSEKALAAIGFINQANDSAPHKTKAKTKFTADLNAAKAADPNLAVFVFFTNISLTATEKDNLHKKARAAGIGTCEIFDRERIRIALDAPDGLSIRYQFLQIPLSEAEQAAFFSRWGDDIRSVISEGFGQVRQTLNRIQFLYEASSVLSHFTVLFELDREYLANEIPHVRSFCHLLLSEPVNTILAVLFGTADNASRSGARSIADLDDNQSGIAEGFSGGCWEWRIDHDGPRSSPNKIDEINSEGHLTEEKHTTVSRSASIGCEKIRVLPISFGFTDFLRFGPYFRLKDIDACTITFFINRSVATKIKKISFFANEYKLAELGPDEFRIDSPLKDPDIPFVFSESELRDEWVRIMGPIGAIQIHFSSSTPIRRVEAKEVSNN